MNEETLNTQNEIDKEGIDSIQNLIEKDAEDKDNDLNNNANENVEQV